MGILAFITGNIKWVAIIALVAALSMGAWRYTKLVENYAIAQNTIAIQTQAIADKEKALEDERALREIAEDITNQVIEQNTELNERLQVASRNLSEDSKELAPESLRETLKRLRDQAQ